MTTNSTEPSVLKCFNPATGELLDELPIAGPDEISAAHARAREGFEKWSRFPLAERCRVLLRARDLLMARADEMIDLLVSEVGRSRMDCYPDIAPLSESIEYYTNNAERFLAVQPIRTRAVMHKRTFRTLAPRGVVLNISCSNYPIETSWGPAIAALLAGNAVINKPSEHSPLCSLRVREILVEAGVPEGAAQVVIGGGEVGEALIPGSDFVLFTGTSDVGHQVAKACVEGLIPYSLAMGGKDPAIVLGDAYLERAVNGAVWGAFYNAGQTCVSVERCYVVESIYDEFLERAIAFTRSLRQGIDGRFTVEVGSMTSLAHLEKVDAQVREAVEAGATVRTGGRRNPEFPEGAFYEPTILTEVDHSMRVMTEETCGPVLPIMKVKDVEEAIRLANDSRYGLNSSVYTQNPELGRRVADRLEVGVCNINECMVQYCAPELPFGGIKRSGLGWRKGADGMRRFCNPKIILEDRLGLDREPVWYPYSEGAGNTLHKITVALYRSGLADRIRALID